MTDKEEILDFELESKKIWDSFCDDFKTAGSLRGFESLSPSFIIDQVPQKV